MLCLREGENEKRVYPNDAQLEVVIRWLGGGADRSLGWFPAEQAMELLEKLKEPIDRFSSLPCAPLSDEFEVMVMDGNRCRVIMTEREAVKDNRAAER